MFYLRYSVANFYSIRWLSFKLLALPTHVILWISSVSRQNRNYDISRNYCIDITQPRSGLFSTRASITSCHEKHTFNSSKLNTSILHLRHLSALSSYVSDITVITKIKYHKVSFNKYSSLCVTIDSQHVDQTFYTELFEVLNWILNCNWLTLWINHERNSPAPPAY